MANVEEVERVFALERAEVPAAKVAALADVVANPQFRDRGRIVEVDHGAGIV